MITQSCYAQNLDYTNSWVKIVPNQGWEMEQNQYKKVNEEMNRSAERDV